MFEEHNQLTGVMGSLDYSLELTKLDQMGDIWEAEVQVPGEEDRCDPPSDSSTCVQRPFPSASGNAGCIISARFKP